MVEEWGILPRDAAEPLLQQRRVDRRLERRRCGRRHDPLDVPWQRERGRCAARFRDVYEGGDEVGEEARLLDDLYCLAICGISIAIESQSLFLCTSSR